MTFSYPSNQGMYDSQFEKDNCGVGFVVHMKGVPSHQIVVDGLRLLHNLVHRGALVRYLREDPNAKLTGDGAGVLMQIPFEFFDKKCKEIGIELPERGKYGIGVVFLPRDEAACQDKMKVMERTLDEEGLKMLGWRDVPFDGEQLGQQAKLMKPTIKQFFVAAKDSSLEGKPLQRKLYVAHKMIENNCADENFSIPSLSSTLVTYKGMLTAEQLGLFYTDLLDPSLETAIIMSHTRFPTNTHPRWDLAQPFRMLAHNGEINTLRGNINWMHAREGTIQSDLFENIDHIKPIIRPRGSDSACFDNVFEFLVMSGYSIAEAIMFMVPEAWENNPDITPEKRAFFEYHEHLMEPWDGPAALCFTDGVQVGANLDRNGLRPARIVVTHDDRVIMSSEVGCIDIDPANIKRKTRLRPGRMFLVDTHEGRIIADKEIKTTIAKAHPYQQWLDEQLVLLEHMPQPENLPQPDLARLIERQKVHGYTLEDINIVLTPMIVNGQEATGSMGNDTPLAALSDRPQLLFNYFKQLFAQVSNPAIDSIREEIVMSLTSHLGKEVNILKRTPEHARLLRLDHPVLTNEQLAKMKKIDIPNFKSQTYSILFKASEGAKGMEARLDEIFMQAEKAIDEGCTLVILSDRGFDQDWAPIPSLLAVAGLHHHLVRRKKRTSTGIVIETGEAREIAHFAVLIGYGAGAVNPYLAYDTFAGLINEGILPAEITLEKAISNYRKAIKKGLFKIFAKMGISTIQSYRGAQIFEAIGLSNQVIDKYFTNTASRVEGITINEICEETLLRHRATYAVTAETANTLELGGNYMWRRRGEYHQVNPVMIERLQTAAQKNSEEAYRDFSRLVNEPGKLSTLRSLMQFKTGTPIPIEEVEEEKDIVARFATGAMSYGSISREAHETLAIAMNKIGGRSNSGEGGEDIERFNVRENGDWPNSNIKQVASGRFGVTINYLAHCKELQIKVAQGAKPGEGGQLPGRKVSEEIAKVRFSTPGVTLISPPPHHDIYSIEDLAQLIFDLKNANPDARVTVKLVAEAGVGTIAAGVAKAHADMIVIAGHDGGTGASPQTSIKYAGVPWELGLSEAHQTLMINRLRDRVRLQTDGQLKTGRDVVIAAMLGAEEFGFSTAPLIATGCIMMRKCHLNTCPVGIATQDPRLREKFIGQPEHVINYFFFVAKEVREIMASLGIRNFNDLIGRTDLLEKKPNIDHWKAKYVSVDKMLHKPKLDFEVNPYCLYPQDHEIEKQMDWELIEACKDAIENRTPVALERKIRNVNRTVGTILSNRIALKYGDEGLPDHTIQFKFYGSAGQSFGAFAAKGVTLMLEGDANDYVGKGLSGGRVVVYPPKQSTFVPEDQIIIGNTVLYGATSGELYARGWAGERFAVRNSGAHAVIEGVGDHGCEYMTGGRVLVLGHTGRNFAAGMSGGIAYVFNEAGTFEKHCNKGMVELEELTDPEEIQFVHDMITRHVKYTQSGKGERVLADWNNNVKRFVKVMPTEYRLVLEKMQAAKMKIGA